MPIGIDFATVLAGTIAYLRISWPTVSEEDEQRVREARSRLEHEIMLSPCCWPSQRLTTSVLTENEHAYTY